MSHGVVDDASILERLFEDSPLPIAILEPDGRTRRMNDAHAAFLHAFGESAGLHEDGLDDLRAVRAGHADAMRRALRGEVVEYAVAVPERPREVRDGAQPEPSAFFSRLLVPVTDKQGRVSSVVSVLLDVTEERRAAAERERLQERIVQAQKLESLGLLAGGVAHDFNNLLVGVLGHASLLSRKLEPGSELRKHVDGIETAAKRASEVARQMLSYAGRGKVVREEVDLRALVEETAELLRVSLPSAAQMSVTLPRSLPPVCVDAVQLRQLTLNLITNAAEALPAGSGSIAIRCGTMTRAEIEVARCLVAPQDSADNFVFVEVSDDGHGMDPATLQRVFDPFFSTKATGRGLGLATVLGVVRAHNGALWVQTAPHQGTCMRVLLPGESVSGLHLVEPRPKSEPAQPAIKVLIVDDEPNVREVAAGMLGLLGFDVTSVGDGEQAISACDQTRFSLVLLDVTMPGLDGPATLARLRVRHPELPVLWMSGVGSPPDHGAGFLPKPFSLDELQRAVTTATLREA